MLSLSPPDTEPSVFMENLYFPEFLDLDFPPKQVDARGSRGRGRGVLVGESVRTLEFENLHFLGVLVGEPVHHTQAAAAHSGVDTCSSADAVVRMPVLGTVHVTLGGELAPVHLPQCALGPSVTGHGASLDIFPHPSKL